MFLSMLVPFACLFYFQYRSDNCNYDIEYGTEGMVSTSIDVYSFGVILMETFSRRKPSDEMFSENLSLKKWVEESLPDALQVIDANLIRTEDKHFTEKLECVLLIMQLALNCCKECPGERMNMKDVLVELKNIQHQISRKVSCFAFFLKVYFSMLNIEFHYSFKLMISNSCCRLP